MTTSPYVLREHIRSIVNDWAVNPKTGYVIHQRNAKFERLLDDFNVNKMEDIPDAKLRMFLSRVDNMINGVTE